MKNKKTYFTVILLAIFVLLFLNSCADIEKRDDNAAMNIYSGIESIDEKELLTENSMIFTDQIEEEFNDMQGDTNEYGPPTCNHMKTHRIAYHSVDALLIDYVGQENFDNWLKITDELDKVTYPNNECSCMNIVYFVQYFDISREIFQAFLDNSALMYYNSDYNLQQ